jgi:hypothetical protein
MLNKTITYDEISRFLNVLNLNYQLQKLKESGVLSDTAKVLPNVDFEDIQKEMLDLAEKIQAVTKPKSEILKPPLVRAHLRGRGTKDNQKDIKSAKSTLDLDQDSFINAKLNSKDTMENKITTTNEDGKVTVNLPRIGNVIKISPTLDSGASEIEEFESESIDHPVTCDVMYELLLKIQAYFVSVMVLFLTACDLKVR